MKVLSILALCAILFFAVTYANQTEDEEQAIEQNGIQRAVENEDEERALQQDILREIQERGNIDAQTLQTTKAHIQKRIITRLRRHSIRHLGHHCPPQYQHNPRRCLDYARRYGRR